MGLYIHVPFCGSICSYCHFSRTADHHSEVRSRFVEAVVQEFDLRWRACPSLRSSRKIGTTYLGGGTPSELEPDLMRQLLEGTVGRLNLDDDFELTSEANPESFDEEKALAWRRAGINRISLGVQSLDEGVLKLLGRDCQPETARRALALACRTFERVSADWILGPGLDQSSLLAELDEAVDLGVEHFSLYILELHQGTALQKDVARGVLRLPPDSYTEKLYLAAVQHLAERGIRQYEVSNFCRPGAESRHNGNYWKRKPWLGLGPSAHGCYGPRRYANEDRLSKYLELVQEGKIPEKSVDPLDLPARRLERAILALRTTEGLPLGWLQEGCLDLEQGQKQGLWVVRDQRLQLTCRGFLLIDSIELQISGCLMG